jgi:hypothetical protein
MATNTGFMFYSPNQLQERDSFSGGFTTKLQTENARSLFIEARWRADFGGLKALLSGKRNMPTLSSRLTGKLVRGQHSRGLCTIEMGRIVGSESRVEDFDRNFNPRREDLYERWIRIAEIFMGHTDLPPVDVIQVGDEYFVRDGHHRVSVGRALGYAFIEANVTVIEVS